MIKYIALVPANKRRKATILSGPDSIFWNAYDLLFTTFRKRIEQGKLELCVFQAENDTQALMLLADDFKRESLKARFLELPELPAGV